MGSETQVSLRAPVWKCRTLLDCSDNEKQDPEGPTACLAQQEPGLMELLSCRVTNSAPVSSSETQVMQSGHDLAGIVCPKENFFFF